MAESGKRLEPIISTGFSLKLGGNAEAVATIKEVDGIELETDVRELIQAGADGKQVWIKSQGAMNRKMGKLTIKYAAFKGDPIMKWRKMVIEGKMEDARQNITLTAHTVDDKNTMTWDFDNCWPSKWSLSSFNATSNDPVIVTVVIEHEGMKLNK